MSETEQFEHYTPQHPLPEELKKMERDETVCRYCGVSYLIHNEIKALEEKLKAVELELECYKGCEEREQKLKEDLKQVQKEKLEMENQLSANTAVISTLNDNLKNEEEKTKKLQIQKRQLEIKMSEAIESSERYKWKHSVYENNLPSIVHSLKQQRSALKEIHDFVEQRDKQTKEEIATIVSHIGSAYHNDALEQTELRKRVQELESEKSENSLMHVALTDKVRKQQDELKKLQKVQDANSALTAKCDLLESNVFDLKKELEESISRCRSLSMETQQFKDQLKNKIQEVEDMTASTRKRDQNSEMTVQKMQADLRKKETELQTAEKQLKNLENKFFEQQMKEEEINRRATLSVSESRELKEALAKANDEIEALKSERDVMITSHQNRIQQLRESFKQKMSEAERWPEKLEEALKAERSKHAEELRALENGLKESFVMEMQIEKQKYQELLEKYQAGNKDQEVKLKAQLSALEVKHKAEMRDMQKLLDDHKERALNTENSLRREVERLKDIIKDLENRLACLDSGNEKLVADLKSQLKGTHQELESARSEVQTRDEELHQTKEEILFLQETVRRECEERFELTESLSEAREQLLQFKKPTGGYTTQPAATPRTQSANLALTLKKTMENMQNSNSNSSQSIVRPAVEEHSRQSTASSSSSHRQNSANSYGVPQSPSQREFTPTQGSNMIYQGESAKSSGLLKGGTVAENRKRIAAILGRNAKS